MHRGHRKKNGIRILLKPKKRAEIREFFNEALEFIKQNQAPETIISAVVHLDEKSPHMHLCFVPLTEDKRLCAKEILGNKKKLTQWQDKYWEHMVKKYPDLERGESASETGRDHIPTRVFKQMARLNRQHDKLAELLSDMKFTNYKERSAQIAAFLERYIPDVAAMETQMKKYEKFFKTADGKQKALEKKNADLSAALEKSEQQSTLKKLQEARLLNDYERIKGILDHLRRVVVPGDTDHLPVGAHRVHHELHQLVQAVPVKLMALDEVVILDVLQNQFPIALALPHPVPSHPVRTPGGLGD